MKISDDEVWHKQLEEMGVNQVRARLLEWPESLKFAATRWLAEKDHEAARLAKASTSAQIEATREANRLASEANSIARAAAASARAAADAAAVNARAARTNNVIATIALIAAVIAIAISILGLFIKH
jgi:hypothetical protein